MRTSDTSPAVPHSRLPRLVLLACGLLPTVAVGQVVPDDHDDPSVHSGHTDHADHAGHDHGLHQPRGVHGHSHAGHAHPGIDLSHPIVVESPLPETKLRINYGFADTGEGTEHVAELEGEYAFTQQFSVEVVLPYVFTDPDDADSTDRLGDAIVAAKFASYRWVDRQFMPAVGLELGLPTGNEESGIGSDHVVELEPFVRLGAWRGKFEFIGTFAVGIPLNQTSEERADDEDFELAYGLSTLYHVVPHVQALLEFTGESVFGPEDATAIYVSPGVTFQPFPDRSVNLGLGVTLPITDDRDFDYALNALCIFHF